MIFILKSAYSMKTSCSFHKLIISEWHFMSWTERLGNIGGICQFVCVQTLTLPVTSDLYSVCIWCAYSLGQTLQMKMLTILWPLPWDPRKLCFTNIPYFSVWNRFNETLYNQYAGYFSVLGKTSKSLSRAFKVRFLEYNLASRKKLGHEVSQVCCFLEQETCSHCLLQAANFCHSQGYINECRPI